MSEDDNSSMHSNSMGEFWLEQVLSVGNSSVENNNPPQDQNCSAWALAEHLDSTPPTTTRNFQATFRLLKFGMKDKQTLQTSK